MSFIGLIALVTFTILALPVLRTLDSAGQLPRRVQAVVAVLSRVRVTFLLAMLALLVILVAGPQSVEPPAVRVVVGLVAAGLVLLYLHRWVRAFLFLMARSDHDFPGRFDKLIWATVLIALGPLGLWVFLRYREAQWPELVVEGTTAAPGKPAAARDWF
jgi:hypothetical protein